MLEARPISLADANAYVNAYHRHHIAIPCHKWSIAAWSGDKMVGVAIVNRPVARALDDGKTVEVVRLCTDGTKNVCSFLYGRCARIAKDIGYDKIITYILRSESGDSLRAAGWTCESESAGGGSWDCPSRPRSVCVEEIDIFGKKQKYPTEKKKRYAKVLRDVKDTNVRSKEQKDG